MDDKISFGRRGELSPRQRVPPYLAPKRHGNSGAKIGCRGGNARFAMGFGRREAAREVEKVEVGARTLRRRLLAR